jgi:hypothetical protein
MQAFLRPLYTGTVPGARSGDSPRRVPGAPAVGTVPGMVSLEYCPKKQLLRCGHDLPCLQFEG